MSMLRDMMVEERERLMEAVKIYEKKIKKLPRGSIVKKNIKGKYYAYLNYRSKGEHFSVYIGAYNCEKAKKLVQQINERRKLETLLKQAKENLEEVMRFFRGEKEI